MGLLSFTFRDQLYGPWDTAKSALIEQLDQWVASLNASGSAASSASAGVGSFITGDVKLSASTTAQDGWLLCDGATYSRVTKQRLFNVIGVTYGVGDGSTTFAVPDLRQRFPIGLAAGGTGSVLGGTGGAIDHGHSVPALTIAAEAVSGTTGTGTTGTGTTDTGTTGTGAVGPTAFALQAGGVLGVAAAGAVAFTTTVNFTVPGLSVPGLSVPGLSVPSLSVTATTAGGLTGTGTSGTNNPPFLAMPYFIKD